ncbi:hypothetical protein [Gemmatimonas sp.]|uniref:hypothetical protein n=2 Tax=Gemmatimonas sp. TaxID=1962908 RepID=UPI0025C60B90|nr:hypothetical protein [Gemmatimonas sp.]MCA2982517.1 hypothetical protein [Gemmatimonas sp.]MCA2987961.1 hypothetical protein [Gemmatimonas sp.]MCA2990124.1 hypothetical protein [Gemmatimonas sp.]MCA2995710.1 hypothetical protein [Gemmatimonas sp.]MCE2952715.1 hypothetical protein [Gemmatimonas sp.]
MFSSALRSLTGAPRRWAGAALVGLPLLAAPVAAQGPPVGRPPGAPGGGPPGGMPPGAMRPDSATLQSQAIRVFLDCQGRIRGCDRDFIVTDVNFVNWMRDRFDADVQILVSGLTNGGGGTENTITFIGRRAFEGMADTLVLNTLPNDPDDRIRRELARVFKLGLTRYVARSPIASRVQVAYIAPFGRPTQQQASAADLKDKWNLWTYTTNMNAFVRAEDRQQSVNASLSLSANRATEKWKMNFSLSGNINEQRFEIPPTATRPAFTVTNEQRTYNATSLIVRSLSSHWSAGLKLGAGYSDFLNQDLALRAQPAIEYNLFPWTEQTRRQLTFLYNVGPNYYDYQRTTVFDRDTETRFSQQATASYVARQSWGSSNVSLDWLNYLHDFNRHALTLSGNVDLRLGRGFSLNIGGSAARINDQIYLPRAGNTEEEILLQRQALETGFRITTNIGIRYTFGSIYNTIVNQRFSSLGSSGGRFAFFFF